MAQFGFITVLVMMTCYTKTTSSQAVSTTFNPPGPATIATPVYSCNNTWITMSNMNVLGGVYYPSPQTPTDCQTACVNASNCTGIDFDGANRCWLIFTNAFPQTVTSGSVTHYQLIRSLNSCAGPACSNAMPAAWNLTQNSHVIGGTQTNDTTINACLQRCLTNVNCYGFDWDNSSSTQPCWITLNQNPAQNAQNVNHFFKLCNSAGFQVVTANFIPVEQRGGSAGATFSIPASTTFFIPSTTTQSNNPAVQSSMASGSGQSGSGGQTGSGTSTALTSSLIPVQVGQSTKPSAGGNSSPSLFLSKSNLCFHTLTLVITMVLFYL